MNFEDLASSLFEETFGVRVEQFGVGPDGMREATYEGRTSQLDEEADAWDGYIVLQAKFRQRPIGASEDSKWFIKTLSAELQGWESKTSARHARHNRPDYMVIATNVVLTPPDGGGVDAAREISEYARAHLGVKDILIWHHDKICRMLDSAQGIRRAYAALITSGDVLAKLQDFLEQEAATIGDSIRAFTSQCLIQQRHIHLTESGGTGALTIEQVGVDLPCSRLPGTDHTDAVKAILEIGDRDLRPNSSASLDPTYLVLGGPGQGKSTLSKMVAQIYRSTLLAPGVGRNNPQVSKIISETQDWMKRSNIDEPLKKRWPIRIDLSRVDSGQALMKTITKHIEEKLGYLVPATSLFSWLKQWPWALILDGLDEVAASKSRAEVTEAVTSFLAQAASWGCDLLTIITTRPQGYDNEFEHAGVRSIELSPLSPTAAVQYARIFASFHFGDDQEEASTVIDSLSEASQDENVSRLLQSPLQATIMTLLMATHGHAPRSRYLLFNAYYETVYRRETSKSAPIAKVLRENQPAIERLHERSGMLLQHMSQAPGNFDAALGGNEIANFAKEDFLEAGFDDVEAEHKASELVRAATERLVLLVPKREGFGFEVRSIQEYMAARAIVSGLDNDVIDRLHAISLSAHWRNTWLFAFGRCVSDRHHLEPRLLEVVRFPGRDPLAKLLGMHIELAVALVLERIWDERPRFRADLLSVILEAFSLPPLPFSASSSLDVLARERPILAGQIRAHVNSIFSEPLPERAISSMQLLKPAVVDEGPLGMMARHFMEFIDIPDAHIRALETIEGEARDTIGDIKAIPLSDFVAYDFDGLLEAPDPGVEAFVEMISSSTAYVDSYDSTVVLDVKLVGVADDLYPVTDDGRIALAATVESIPRNAWVARAVISETLWRSGRRRPVGY